MPADEGVVLFMTTYLIPFKGVYAYNFWKIRVLTTNCEKTNKQSLMKITAVKNLTFKCLGTLHNDGATVQRVKVLFFTKCKR